MGLGLRFFMTRHIGAASRHERVERVIDARVDYLTLLILSFFRLIRDQLLYGGSNHLQDTLSRSEQRKEYEWGPVTLAANSE
jgi:hypothetical protein